MVSPELAAQPPPGEECCKTAKRKLREVINPYEKVPGVGMQYTKTRLSK